MAALAASRNTQFRQVRGMISIPLKANAKVFKGGIVAVDATGYGVQGATATGLIVAGMALADADNTGGANGAISVDCLNCEVYVNNSGTDAVVQASLLGTVYLVDDNTVSKTNGTSTESAAGTCTGLDANGVWVRIGVM